MNPTTSPLSAERLKEISSGRAGHATIIEQEILNLAAEKGFVAALIQQALENAVDNGANHIDIKIKPADNQFIIVNDGRGIEADDVAHLNSLGVRHERAGGEITGKHNTGRLSYLAVAEGGVEFFFRSKDFPVINKLVFTRELANQLLREPDKFYNPPVEVESVPDCWPKELETGTVVVLNGVRWKVKVVQDITTIRTQLMRHLGPWTTEKVRLNGKALPSHFPEGKKYPGTHDLGGELGKIDYVFGIPQGRTKAIKLGGKNPLCTLEKFCDGIKDPALFAKLPPWMLESDKLAGFINIPILNERYAGPDRRSVTENLYEDTALVEAIVKFLQEIGPKLEEFFELRQYDYEGGRDADDDMKTLAELCPVDESFSGPKPAVRGPKGPKPEVMLTPREYVCKPGVEIEIHLARGRAGGTWNIPDGAGTITDTQPRSIRLLVGEKIGSHKITYTHKGKGGDKTGEMVVEISEEQKPSIQGPLHFPAPARHRFNINGYDGEISGWRINSDEITFSGNNGKKYMTMNVPRKCRPDTYKIEVLGKDGVVIAERNIWIEAPDNRFIGIGGKHFELEANVSGSRTFMFHPKPMDNGRNQYDGIVTFNMMSENAVQHRDLFGEGTPANNLALMHLLCAAFVQKHPNTDQEKLIAEQLAKLPKPKTP